MKLPNVAGISVEISVIVGSKLEVKMESIVGTSWVVVVWMIAVVVVSISSNVFGTNGYFKQGKAIGGPSMFSKTYPTREPAVRPVMYEIVIMFPAISFKGAETFDGASSIGKLPASPLETPSAAVKKNAGNSPETVGFLRGATHKSRSGISKARKVDMRTSCRLDQAYGTAAKTFPTTSHVLNVNISNTGLE